jgi:subtilisin family serine protease
MVYRVAAGTDLTTSDSLARLNRVRDLACVREVITNRQRRARGAPLTIPVLDGDLDPRSVREQFAVAQCSLNAAQAGASGAGVVVAVLDGGFDLAHPHLAGRIHAAKWDTLDDDNDPQDVGNNADDDEDGITDNLVGHGTFVSSIVLAGAPNATILPIRCLDDEGYGSQLAVAQAIQRAVDAGANVINLSLTIPAASDLVRDAISNALEAGVPVVVAAGNEVQWQFDPRLAGRIVTVGAVDSADVLAAFSVTGERVAVYAPGVSVIGALGGKVPGSYARWSGTSFSTAWVSGATALARQVAAGESPRDLRREIVRTADEAYGVGGSRGRLDADAFLDRATGN